MNYYTNNKDLAKDNLMIQQMQLCENCKQMISTDKITTHIGYCRRNVKKCGICEQMYDINYIEQHEEQFHKKNKCQLCKRQFSKDEFKNHGNLCRKKPRYCDYCQQNIPLDQYSTHLKMCQSRTRTCEKCQKIIINTDYFIHIGSCIGSPIKQPIKQVQEKNKILAKPNKILDPPSRRQQFQQKQFVRNKQKQGKEPQAIQKIVKESQKKYAEIQYEMKKQNQQKKDTKKQPLKQQSIKKNYKNQSNYPIIPPSREKKQINNKPIFPNNLIKEQLRKTNQPIQTYYDSFSDSLDKYQHYQNKGNHMFQQPSNHLYDYYQPTNNHKDEEDIEFQKALMESMGARNYTNFPEQFRGMEFDQAFMKDISHQDAIQQMLKKRK